MKVEWKLALDPELAERIEAVHAQYKAANRKTHRNDVIVQLIEDGFRWWSKEQQKIDGLDATLGKLLDQSKQQDRLLRTVLLTLAEGRADEYQRVIDTIEREHKRVA